MIQKDWGFLILATMNAVAVVIKEKDIAGSSGALNHEATHHALLTIELLRPNEIKYATVGYSQW